MIYIEAACPQAQHLRPFLHLADNVAGGLVHGELRAFSGLSFLRLVARARCRRLLSVTATHDSPHSLMKPSALASSAYR